MRHHNTGRLGGVPSTKPTVQKKWENTHTHKKKKKKKPTKQTTQKTREHECVSLRGRRAASATTTTAVQQTTTQHTGTRQVAQRGINAPAHPPSVRRGEKVQKEMRNHRPHRTAPHSTITAGQRAQPCLRSKFSLLIIFFRSRCACVPCSNPPKFSPPFSSATALL